MTARNTDARCLDLTTLRVRPGAAPRLAEAARNGLLEFGKGTIVGCWISEIGVLNQIVILRSFENEATLTEDHACITNKPELLGCGDGLVSLRQEGFLAATGLPVVLSGELGSVYEFRRYSLERGGLAPTLAAWREAIEQRTRLSPLA